MNNLFKNLKEMVEQFGSAPTLEEMPKRTLKDKGINGPTAAHIIEEVHVPLNLAYITFTTGSSAFQNIVGVTHTELQNRVRAAHRVLEIAGVRPGDKILFTYPLLVNVFSKKALEEYGLKWFFLSRSSRDAFLSKLYEENPDVIVGESSFLRASLDDAKKLGLAEYLPKKKIFLTAGTPLDLELLPTAEKILDSDVHDLYGCQEFGWLCINGIPVREDISLVKSPLKGYFEVVVGGLPMGDSFIVSDSGHVCNNKGKIITYRRERTYPEYEVIMKSTRLSSAVTAGRAVRTMLRTKGRIVKVDPNLKVAQPHTILELKLGIGCLTETIIIEGPEKTILFDDLIEAQLEYQQSSKNDPTWIKQR